MVTDSLTDTNGWRTRPDYLQAAKALANEDARLATTPPPAVDEVKKLRERSARLVQAKQTAAQKRFEEKIAAEPKGHKPGMTWVRASDVRFDDRYQTDDRYDVARARRIAEEWDWNTPTLAITVNVRPDDPNQTLWCPDGRHRANAALMRFGPNVKLPALMHQVSYAEEAAMFAHQDENRKRVSDTLKFNAGKEAGEAMPLEAQAMADRLGVTLSFRAETRGIATKTFLELIRLKGPVHTEMALRLVLDRWDGDASSLDARVLKGMTYFLARYHDHPHFSHASFVALLNKISIPKLIQESSRYQTKSVATRIAAALVGLYNYKRQLRLPEWGVS